VRRDKTNDATDPKTKQHDCCTDNTADQSDDLTCPGGTVEQYIFLMHMLRVRRYFFFLFNTVSYSFTRTFHLSSFSNRTRTKLTLYIFSRRTASFRVFFLFFFLKQFHSTAACGILLTLARAARFYHNNGVTGRFRRGAYRRN
jgi:hypothetical protein